jgi:hypothetical protein
MESTVVTGCCDTGSHALVRSRTLLRASLAVDVAEGP